MSGRFAVHCFVVLCQTPVGLLSVALKGFLILDFSFWILSHSITNFDVDIFEFGIISRICMQPNKLFARVPTWDLPFREHSS